MRSSAWAPSPASRSWWAEPMNATSVLRSDLAVLHFDATEELDITIEVHDFVVEEALGEAFEVTVHFQSESAAIPFDEIVGRGAALSLKTGAMGERVWAGICSELELEHSEEHTGPTQR